jgi:hypothetical protein
MALDDSDLHELGEWLEPGSPHPVLERGFGNDRYASGEQHPENFEEERDGAHRERIAELAVEIARLGMRHSLLDLVPADGGAGDLVRKRVRERRLPGPGRAADDDQRWQRRLSHVESVVARRLPAQRGLAATVDVGCPPVEGGALDVLEA